MSDISAEELARVNNLPKLVDLLRDHLDWPLEEDDFDEITYAYEPHELGLKDEDSAKVREVFQLRPLVTNQPWGVFFVSFDEKQLSVTVLRRILRALVVTKRGESKGAERAAWDKSDLIFAANFGKSGERELAFVHFSDGADTGDLPVMKVLGWNAKDTKLHNDYAAQMLTRRLAWPDDESDDAAWRKQWSGAFEIGHRQVIKTSRDMALHLAGLATQIRARANELLEAEADDGPMRTMLEAFRKNLIHDLDEDGFADMFAQTICYGMLAAAISRPSDALVADNMADMVPRTNPFLKELFANFLKLGGRDKRSNLDFDEFGVREVVDMLERADMPAVLRDFGDRNPKEDPVIHFYELFLKEYDPAKRMQRGVFYTPRPVVNFIVRAVDEILRTEFGLPLGLADTTTWGELAARNDTITVPDNIDPDQPFVQILDPATGTGTFLVEVIDLIHERMVEHWQGLGKSKTEIAEVWNQYVPAHLLPRLTAFELMMAPYSIAHMKVGLKLTETGYQFGSDERARIFLTNALDRPKDWSGQFTFASEALAHESMAANAAKGGSYTVIVGNPPYSAISSNLTPENRRIVDRYRHVNGVKIRERSMLQFEKNIQDDYLKFFAVGTEYIERSGLGVFCVISNHSFIDGRTLRGVRSSLMSSYDEIRIIDLHGNSLKKEGQRGVEQNVFEIQQGVAITLGISNLRNEACVVYALDVFGTREDKYDWLFSQSALSCDAAIEPREEFYYFRALSTSEDDAWRSALPLKRIMPHYLSGTTTGFDALMVDFDIEGLVKKVSHFLDPKKNDADVAKAWGIKKGHASTVLKRRIALRDTEWREQIRSFQQFPFDRRAALLQKDLLQGHRFEVMEHLSDRHPGLIATLQSKEDFGVFVSDVFCGHKVLGSYDRNSVFPSYDTTLERNWIEDKEFLRLAHSLEQAEVESGLFDWIYAILHAPSYRSRYAEFLKSDFPRIPIPKDRDTFAALVPLGRRLVALHLLKPEEETVLKNPDIRFAGAGEARVDNGYPKYKNGKVEINANRWFEDVQKEAWEFHVGGYQVCDKWLKDRSGKGGKNPRPGRLLTEEDILHYRRVVTALTETRKLMAEIDEAIEKHGGWPGAFAIGADAEESE